MRSCVNAALPNDSAINPVPTRQLLNAIGVFKYDRAMSAWKLAQAPLPAHSCATTAFATSLQMVRKQTVSDLLMSPRDLRLGDENGMSQRWDLQKHCNWG